jgi:hypothetical protein
MKSTMSLDVAHSLFSSVVSREYKEFEQNAYLNVLIDQVLEIAESLLKYVLNLLDLFVSQCQIAIRRNSLVILFPFDIFTPS